MASNRVNLRAAARSLSSIPSYTFRHASRTPQCLVARQSHRSTFSSHQQCRHLSDDSSKPSSTSKIYHFSSIQSRAPSTLLIDVREPHEFSAGHIPTAVNMPLQSQPGGIFMPREDFLEQFGFEKPVAESEVVFYCKAGVRSKAAAAFAREAGYKKVGEYPGSWMDWIKNGGGEEK